jgi:hypothetical protein
MPHQLHATLLLDSYTIKKTVVSSLLVVAPTEDSCTWLALLLAMQRVCRISFAAGCCNMLNAADLPQLPHRYLRGSR